MKNKILLILIVIVGLFIITGCGGNSSNDNKKSNSNEQTNYQEDDNTRKLDYDNAETFEKALNNGEKVDGKIVSFEVKEYHPDSILGVNCWAGEHLNFISKEELSVDSGDTIIGKITKEPKSQLGSWIINYEVISINKKEIKEEIAETTKDDKEETIEEEQNSGNKLDEFIKGYTKGEYNSAASSEGTNIYIKGKLDEIEVLGSTENNQMAYIIGYIEDENKNMWSSLLNTTAYVSTDYYDKYVKKDIYLRGLNVGLADSSNTPIINMDEMYIIETEEIVTGLQYVANSKTDSEVIMFVLPEEYIGDNYSEVENELKKLGFTNIKTEAKETSDSNNKDGSICEFSIGNKNYKRGDKLNKSDEVKIVYWKYKKQSTGSTQSNSVSYSTNDTKKVKEGNSGKYAYSSMGAGYDSYYIIDFTTSSVYYFHDGNGSNTYLKGKIVSGNLNTTLVARFSVGSRQWVQGFHFKWKNMPNHLIVEDEDHSEYDYYPTSLSEAQKILKQRQK